MGLKSKAMAKDTLVLVTVPGTVNEKLARYKFWLEDKGVIYTKAEMIIRLAAIALKEALKEVDEDDDDDDDDPLFKTKVRKEGV